MSVTRFMVGLVLCWCSVCAPASAADGEKVPVHDLLASPEYVGAPLDGKLARLDAWIADRGTDVRDAEWARAASQRIMIIAQQGDFETAEQYADDVLEDMLSALSDSGDFISAAYGVGFIKVFSQRIDETLRLVDRMRNHPAFDSDPIYQQNIDTLMVTVHSQTGNPILAAGVFIDKYNDGSINKLPPIDQLKLISNISYALIRGRSYEEAQYYLDVASNKLSAWIDSGLIDPLNVRRVRWHINYNQSKMLAYQEKFDEIVPLYPSLKTDSEHIGGPLYATQTDYVAAAIAYNNGEHDKAADLIGQTIEKTTALGATDVLIDLYDLQAKNYQAANRPQDALQSYLDGKALDDALKAEQGRARVEYMNTRRILIERNAQIKELEAKTTAAEQMRRRDQIIAAVSLAGLTLVLVFALALVRSRRRLRIYADELETSEKKALIAAQAKAAFLANMSHEIRTPLNGLLGMTQVLAEQRYDSEHDECVDIILRSGESLLTIVNDVLDLSKIEAGKMTVAPTATNIRDLVDELTSLWSVSAKEKGIALHVHAAPNLPASAMFDGARVRQCASNLISNAIKFTEEGQVSINVSASDDGEMLTICVEDTGLGIKDDAVATLFSAFEQGDTSSTRKFGGTGLGLSIVHSFAELMGGEVSVSSTYGEGSRFTLCIPIVPIVEQAPAEPSNENVLAASAPQTLSTIKTILVVDDNHVNRMVVKAFLKKSGVRIVEAENGVEALDYLRTVGDADLVLLDMHMPEMDGPECIMHIRASQAPWRDIPILVLTADAMEGDRERYLELSVQGYLAKPVVQNDLWAEVCQIDASYTTERLSKSA
ncbi:MAG: ATP-binding protein [Pseudomonadota bacterium]